VLFICDYAKQAILSFKSNARSQIDPSGITATAGRAIVGDKVTVGLAVAVWLLFVLVKRANLKSPLPENFVPFSDTLHW
jgi:hypothetical protein